MFSPGEKNCWQTIKKCLKEDFIMCNTYKTLSIKNIIYIYCKDRGFRYVVWLRLCNINILFIRIFAKIKHRLLSTRYGIQIPSKTKIGIGLRINHGHGVIINETAIIGNFCVLHQFTTIGTWTSKAATIGNNVKVGPGVCIVDDVNIGDNVIIGAGSVVVKDIPSHSIAAGNPAKIIKKI